MNHSTISPEQTLIIEKVEFQISEIKEQEKLYQAIRQLLHSIPNNYDLGVVMRQLFS